MRPYRGPRPMSQPAIDRRRARAARSDARTVPSCVTPNGCLEEKRPSRGKNGALPALLMGYRALADILCTGGRSEQPARPVLSQLGFLLIDVGEQFKTRLSKLLGLMSGGLAGLPAAPEDQQRLAPLPQGSRI